MCAFRAKIQRENAIKSEKHLGNWIGIVLCISLSIRKIEGRWQINNEKEKTERDVSSYFLFIYLFYYFPTIKITQALHYTKMWRGDLRKPQGLYEEAPSLQ